MRSLSEGFTLRPRRRRTNEREPTAFMDFALHLLTHSVSAAATAVMCATVAIAAAAAAAAVAAAEAVLERVVPSTEMAPQHES